MEIARTSSTLDIVRSRSRSQRDFEIFLHLPQLKFDVHLPPTIKMFRGTKNLTVVKYIIRLVLMNIESESL